MFFKSLLRYKWYALSSLLMTSLMIASSLLLPWFLKHILDALQEQNSQTIYSMGGWLIGIGFVGLVAGGINVTLAAYIAQAVSSDLREETFRKIQTFSYANIEEFNAGNLVVRMTNDINQILNVTMMLFQILLRLAHPFYRISHLGHCDHALSLVDYFLADCAHSWSNGCHDGDDGPSF